ncbi:malectin domain-containing carbohydrate-binding protein [Aurantibacter sp.]|uniref:malectin domain-containing carbohydrate-binding protein n=1 Tax=Aurantibacter sp. TaxID=2807103 RepID=UPI003264BFDD
MGENYKSILKFLYLVVLLLCSIPVSAQLPTSFQQVELLTGLSNTTTMRFAPDGRIFILDRYGEVLIYKPNSQLSVSAGTIPVFHEFEDGLLGIAFDPNFNSNSYIYLHYSVMSVSKNRVSRFTMNGDQIDINSEITLLEWDTQRTISFHSGGDMQFDSQGNLYIATGDNTDHGNYAALHESDLTKSAEKSSSNTNDLRGKILRIKPLANGSYTIPNGNLFPVGTANTRPEIYVMGVRNAYRIFVDNSNTDWLFWGEVGPDANVQSSLGPEGLDEMNLVKSAGNFGWPYFSGADNDPYLMSYANPTYYNNPAAPQNNSTWNTGLVNLPPAQPAWIEFFHKSYFAGTRYYHDGTLSDQQRLPVEFNEAFFYYDFNTSKIWVIKMDVNGAIISNEQLAPTVFPSSSNGFIDMEIGPDGHMYLLAYGTGCCPSNVGTGKLIRVDYTGVVSNTPPIVTIDSDVTSGSLPLTVNFSSVGTYDQDGDSSLIYSWDFQSDGTVDTTSENPSFTFTSAGTYITQLKVNDGNGGVGVQNISIHAGNNSATFSFNSPVDGGFMNWDDNVILDLNVTDIEDGSTSNGIDCNTINVIPSLGHLNHFHDGATMNTCVEVLSLDPGAHDIDGEMDIFYVLNANYTDQGGLTAFDQIILHPKRKEAEFYTISTGVDKIANTDLAGGGSEAIRVDNDDFISFEGRNLLNINSVKYRVASTLQGGTIEFRIDSPTGQLLATTNIPDTGSNSTWLDIVSTFTDPGGKHDLYFVFKSSSGQQDIFDLNYIEFIGTGVSTDNSPPEVNELTSINSTSTSIKFSEYVSESTAEQTANYSINNSISVSSADLLPDNRTVVLTHSIINTDASYEVSISNVKNLAGLSVVQNSYQLSVFTPIRINVGGGEVTANSTTYAADSYTTGGSLYNRSIAIGNTSDDLLYQTERYGNFTYEIPIPIAGEYDIRLHFAELYFGVGNTAGGEGSRIFNVSIEGNPVLIDFDISTEVAPATALIKDFDNVSVTDGFATVQFSSVVENPKVSAIEILSVDAYNVAPTIAVNSPVNGADVNLPFNVSFTTQNWEIQEGSTHMHYYIDGVMVGPHYSYNPIIFDDLSLGTHSIRLELYEAGHVPTGIYDEVSVNVTSQSVCNSGIFPENWQVHEIDNEELPYRHVYIIPNEDIDGDGLKDIITGAWWYKNPGSASGDWVKKTVGAPLNNIAFAHDFDGDGDIDLFGTQGTYEGVDMAWAENDGSGSFTIHTNIPSENVQTTYWEPLISGIAGGIFQSNGPYQLVITWNGAESDNSPVQVLSVPTDPVNMPWTLTDLSPDSLGEDIIKGDIDRDGDLDLFQSSNWLRNEGNGTFTTIETGISYVSTPDRAQLADFDGDGDLDAVVGQLGLESDDSAKTEFSWFEAPANPTQNWTKHILATDINGSLSVFASDIDFDGDKDIIVGEWRGGHRLIVFQNDLCNSGTWIRKTIEESGNEFDHHNGAQVIDIDNDGDLDIVSIGWSNITPRIFENTSIIMNSGPIVDLMEDQIITSPTSSISLIGSGTDPDGGAVSFLWTQENGPSTATLSGNISSNLEVSNLIEGNYVFRLTITDDEEDTAYAEISITVLPEPNLGDFILRINTGGSEETYNGNNFEADNYFDEGKVLYRPQTGLVQPFSSMRYGPSQQMSYNIPLTDGEYTVKLYFSELWFGATGGGSGGVGSRVFDVNMEGQIVADDLDVFDEVGADAILEKTFIVTVSDGILDIDFSSLESDGGTRHPIINAIEIFGQSTNNAHPTVDLIEDQIITLPTSSITLNGSGSDPDGGTVSFLWTQISGPNTANLLGNLTTDLTVSGLIEGDYVFRFTVTDDEEDSSYKEVHITVFPEVINTQQPIIDLIEDQIITLPTSSISLTGSGSDPDGGNVTFLWTQLSGPTTAVLSGSTSTNLLAANLDKGEYVFRLTVTDDEDDTAYDEVMVTVWPEPSTPNFALRINTGGSEITYNGNIYQADNFYNTGNTLNRPQTGLTQPLSSIRYSPSQQLSYDIPLSNGDYTIKLYFAEVWFGATGGGSGGVGSRVFDVTMEGQLVEDNLDVYREVGADAILVKSHTVNVTDGILNLYFSSLSSNGGVRHPIINAIEILGDNSNNTSPIMDLVEDQIITLPTSSISLSGTGSDPDGGLVSFLWSQTRGPSIANLSGSTTSNLSASNLLEGDYIFRLTVSDDESESVYDEVSVTVLAEPVSNNYALRINTGGSEVIYNGEVFVADSYFDTGTTLNRPQTGLSQPHSSIRYSKSQQMSYNIPLSNGSYTVRLHFAEVWFGATGGGSGGVGSRVFDVRLEGDLAEDNLDVYDIVGAETMLIKAHLVTVTDGELDIDFSSLAADGGARHPIVNAIEIIEMNGGSALKSINEQNQVNEMLLFPNQANTIVTLSFEKPIEIKQILVFDMIGRLVNSYNAYNVRAGDDYILAVDNYQQGAYIVKTVDVKGAYLEKRLVVKHE